ncbi:precorrin-6A reductase [Bacillus sp. DNRA2]|uniref:precorrin-6A reductase n=1 Tax=Bacillus sp. DNRA2 TaxID=2723053 RepID=UPI00145E6AF8|nr:precorrin-6A reductase [Bacillus sp. DNRA2]NMD69681.1 precorrin-6A reductase [Bacillus sp. DNRA2]
MILVLAGTSDARELAVLMKKAGLSLLTTVVTENAAIELDKAGLDVQVGRLTADEMVSLIANRKVRAVVDASHPFAEEASRNAIQAAEQAGIPYIRYERESQSYDFEKLTIVESYETAASLAARKKGVIMLTTGSKTLQIYTERLLELDGVRLIARMLPRMDNLEKCEKLGFPQKNIIAIQGPFSKEFDKALYQQYGVTLMITKDSGKVGSVNEKIAAAKELGIETILIRRPTIAYGNVHHDFNSVLKALNEVAPFTESNKRK